MTYYSDELIEEVRSRKDVVDVISGFVSLQKRGSTYFGLCPFHNEKTPSFSVSPGKQMYYCFGCGAGGNVFTFMMQYENFTFQEAMQSLADRAGIELPKQEMSAAQREAADRRSRLLEINKVAAKYFYMLLRSPQGAHALQYFEERKLSKETMQHFGLGYSNKTSNDLCQYLRHKGYPDELIRESGVAVFNEKYGMSDKFWNRVMFPIQDVNHRVIGFGGRVMGDGEPKYLNSRETILFDKGRNLYGLNYAKRSRSNAIILCEGYMDVISLHQAGFTNAVAPLGTAFTPNQAMLLKRYTNEVILSFDSDGAGIKAALRALPILRQNGLRGRVLSMKPYKDPDELIKAEGAESYQKRIDEAESGRMFELLVLYGQYNQQDPESRTEFLHEVAKKLAQIEEPLERQTYLTSAANRFMIRKNDLENLVNRYGLGYQYEQVNEQYKTAPETEERRQKKKKNTKNQPQRLLLTWLVEHPDMYQYIRPYIGADDFIEPLYHSVAIMLFEQLDKEEKINPAAILSRFTDAEEQKEIAAIFNTHLKYGLSSEDEDKALSDVVRKVKLASIEDEMVHTSDIMRWQELLSLKNKMQKFSINRV